MVLKLNWTHQLFAYTDDVNLLGDNIDTTYCRSVQKRKLACRTWYKVKHKKLKLMLEKRLV
jgi:hypothetical protein